MVASRSDRSPERRERGAGARRSEPFPPGERLRGERWRALVGQSLMEYLPDRPVNVVAVGGGVDQVATRLAGAGHRVVVFEPDGVRALQAGDELAEQPAYVRARILVTAGRHAGGPGLIEGCYDLACCHELLVRTEDPNPMLDALARLVRPGGLLSVVVDAPGPARPAVTPWASRAIESGKIDPSAGRIAGLLTAVGVETEACVGLAGVPQPPPERRGPGGPVPRYHLIGRRRAGDIGFSGTARRASATGAAPRPRVS